MSSLCVKTVQLIALDRNKNEYGVLLILIDFIHINLQNNALSFHQLIEFAIIFIDFVGLNTRELANQDNRRSRFRLIERN